VRDWPERTAAILNRVEAILDRHGLDQAISFQLSAVSRQ